MMIESKKALVLAPHPDDGEFGCGATIARLIEQGTEVRLCAFSLCKESLPVGLEDDHLKTELLSSTKILGFHPKNVIIRDYPVRRFNEHRQDILEEIIQDRNAFSPDLVFLPTATDIHQDHQVIYQEGLRAFKHVTVLGYELPWNTIEFKSNALWKVEEAHLELKIKALQQYKSQSFRPYFQDSFVRSLARVRGTQAAHQYAEAFEVVRLNQ